MEDREKIYFLLLHNNGLKIGEISSELKLDKFYVAELMFDAENISYWYQTDDFSWYAIEGAILENEDKENVEEDPFFPVEGQIKNFNVDRFLQEDISKSLKIFLYQISKYRVFSNEEILELFERYRKGDKKAYELIVKSSQRFIANLAFLYRNKGVCIEDLVQEGNIGLINAIEIFDPKQSYSFLNYAKKHILQAISNAIITLPYIVKMPNNTISQYRKVRKAIEKFEQKHEIPPCVYDIELSENIDVKTLNYLRELPPDLNQITVFHNEFDSMEYDLCPVDDYENEEYNKFCANRLLGWLKRREASIVKQYYGIDTKKRTLLELSTHSHLSGERIRQIIVETLQRMRDPQTLLKEAEEVARRTNAYIIRNKQRSAKSEAVSCIMNKLKYYVSISDIIKESKSSIWKYSFTKEEVRNLLKEIPNVEHIKWCDKYSIIDREIQD